MGSRRSLYLSMLGAGAIALASFACGGFDVPSWTRPAGPMVDEDSTEPEDTRSLDDDGGEDPAPAATPEASAPAASAEAGAPEAGPADAGPG